MRVLALRPLARDRRPRLRDPQARGVADVQAAQEGPAQREDVGRAQGRPAVIAATATGAPRRIDDETAGHPAGLRRATGAIAGDAASSPRACYICKSRYTEVDAFYHQLCPDCARAQPRQARRPHRPDRPARAAHRRPREDRHVHRAAAAARRRAHHDHHPLPATTPCAASRRCRTAPTGCTGCRSSASTCATRPRSSRSPTRSPPQGPLDILINNAAQTVRRSPGAYAQLVDAESRAAAGRARCPSCSTFGRTQRRAHPPALRRPRRRSAPRRSTAAGAHRAGADRRLGLARADRRRHRDRRRRPGARPATTTNSWTQRGRRGRPGRAARGAAVQRDRAVHPGQPAAPGDGGVAGPPHVRRQRLGDGGPVRPRLQGRRATRTPTWPRPR